MLISPLNLGADVCVRVCAGYTEHLSVLGFARYWENIQPNSLVGH